jgi:hypothetical protein
LVFAAGPTAADSPTGFLFFYDKGTPPYLELFYIVQADAFYTPLPAESENKVTFISII